jgi:RIO kinase 1
MIRQIVRMLCAGLIHGDLSEYNVLMGPSGPVIIDLPQAVSASNNNSAFDLLARDVNNMRATFARFVPGLEVTEYAREIWAIYEDGALLPETELTGLFELDEAQADLEAVLDEIEDARLEAEARELARAMAMDS